MSPLVLTDCMHADAAIIVRFVSCCNVAAYLYTMQACSSSRRETDHRIPTLL